MASGQLAAAEAPEQGWARIWPSKDGSVWYALTASEFKQFPLEQLAINWAAGNDREARA